jgi:hypothetical protein
MSQPEHLSQAERLIAECKNRIARQREVIANAFQKGHDTEVPTQGGVLPARQLCLCQSTPPRVQSWRRRSRCARAGKKPRRGGTSVAAQASDPNLEVTMKKEIFQDNKAPFHHLSGEQPPSPLARCRAHYGI